MMDFNRWKFMKEAEARLNPVETKALRALLDYFKSRGDPIKWEKKQNDHGGFSIGFKGIRQDPIVRGYSDGHLHFYTKLLDDRQETEKTIKIALNEYLQERFSANVENPQLFLVRVGAWVPRVDELIDRFRQLLPPVSAS